MARHPGSLAAITPLDTPADVRPTWLPRARKRRWAAGRGDHQYGPGGGRPYARPAGERDRRPAPAPGDRRGVDKDLVYFRGYWVRGGAIE
ncbi:hypothetical protein [Actinophytocola sp.]|uniref:hypothetical protein n=1 Tax=Actinophytocola sp. TaxID=1872138 RepID=UPI002ED87503